MNTKRILGFRLDPENPRKITPQEVSEEVYLAVGRPIWRHQKKMQAQGKCALTNAHQIWKCDGDCELCEFRRLGRGCELDAEIEDADGETCRAIDKMCGDDPSPEAIAMEKTTMELVLERLTEICPEAVQTGRFMEDHELPAYKALKELSIKRTTYLYRLERAKEQLCKEFGVDDISELFPE